MPEGEFLSPKRRDEILVRLDERTARTEKDVDHIKKWVGSHERRIDALERGRAKPAEDGESTRWWVALMEMVAAIPAFWHVALTAGACLLGLLGVAMGYRGHAP